MCFILHFQGARLAGNQRNARYRTAVGQQAAHSGLVHLGFLDADAVAVFVPAQPADGLRGIGHLHPAGCPVAEGGNAEVRFLSVALTIQHLDKALLAVFADPAALGKAFLFSLQGRGLGAGIQHYLGQILQNPGALHVQRIQLLEDILGAGEDFAGFLIDLKLLHQQGDLSVDLIQVHLLSPPGEPRESPPRRRSCRG